MKPLRKPSVKDPLPSGCSRPGQNQPPALKSVAAPIATAASIGSPVLVPRGAIVQATSPGTPCSARSAALPSKPPAASSTPRRARTSTGPSGVIAATPTTRSSVDDQPGDRQLGAQLAALGDARSRRAGRSATARR